jgi:Vault protein inter-alpha-trypsin domain
MFPTSVDIIISKMSINIGDRIVEGKVMDKNQAQVKYDDALAGGKGAVLL